MKNQFGINITFKYEKHPYKTGQSYLSYQIPNLKIPQFNNNPPSGACGIHEIYDTDLDKYFSISSLCSDIEGVLINRLITMLGLELDGKVPVHPIEELKS